MQRIMHVLLGCEESQAVCIEFRKLGHEAFSCDTLPCSGGHPEWHLQMDVFEAIKLKKWDLAIFFPPCTHLAVSGTKYFKEKQADGRQQSAVDFFMALQNTGIPHTATENPVGIMSSKYRRPNQIIQPWMFGHDASKKTCLWLTNLPLLTPTEIINPTNGKYYANQTAEGQNKVIHNGKWIGYNNPLTPHLRSKTYEGIAAAMASQWSNILNYTDMKTEVKKEYVRCTPAFTIQPNRISLISEENNKNYPKGSIVLQVSRDTVYTMHHPVQGQPQVLCEVKKIKVKGGDKVVAKIVLEGEFQE